MLRFPPAAAAALSSLALVAAAACAQPAPPATPQTPAQPSASTPAQPAVSGDIRVGASLSLTGVASVYGDVQKKAMELAADEINRAGGINGSKLALAIVDDASDPQRATDVFKKLINEDKAVALLGPTLSNSALTADPVAQTAKVPVLAVSNTAGGIVEIGNFVFRNSLSEAQVIPTAVKVAKEKYNVKKAALLYGSDDAYTKAGHEVFRDALKANGIEIVAEESFTKGTQDFAAQLAKVKAAEPDVIVASALADEGTLILQQRAKAGIPDSVKIIGGNGFNAPSVIQNAGQASEGLIVGAAWHASADSALNQAFLRAYREKYGADPDQFAAQAYAGAYIMADALKRAGPGAGGDKLREALAATKLATVLGDFTFTAERNASHAPVVQEVRAGKFELLK